MAVKDVINYFNECEKQYKDFKEEMDDFRILCAQNMISPEIVENAQKMFSVVEDNYKKLSYIVFLLNKPVKKKKFDAYTRQNKKLLDKSISKDEVIKQNKENTEQMKMLMENI